MCLWKLKSLSKITPRLRTSSPLPPSSPQTLLRHFSLPPYLPNSVIIPTFTRASFFNWARPCPSSPCQLLTRFRRILCASPIEAAFCVCVRSFTTGVGLIFTAWCDTRCQPQYCQYQGVLCGARVCGTVGFKSCFPSQRVTLRVYPGLKSELSFCITPCNPSH